MSFPEFWIRDLNFSFYCRNYLVTLKDTFIAKTLLFRGIYKLSSIVSVGMSSFRPRSCQRAALHFLQLYSCQFLTFLCAIIFVMMTSAFVMSSKNMWTKKLHVSRIIKFSDNFAQRGPEDQVKHNISNFQTKEWQRLFNFKGQ